MQTHFSKATRSAIVVDTNKLNRAFLAMSKLTENNFGPCSAMAWRSNAAPVFLVQHETGRMVALLEGRSQRYKLEKSHIYLPEL